MYAAKQAGGNRSQLHVGDSASMGSVPASLATGMSRRKS
jgi:hypothetical protein